MTEPIPGTAALMKGISVLRTIAGEEGPVSFSGIQERTGLPKGTLHRILKALIAEGLVRYERRDRSYHLGLQLLSLAYQVLEDIDIRDVARTELVRLRDLTGEAVHLAIRDDLRAVYIDVVDSSLAVGMIARLGASSELHSTAVGKVIAAYLPADQQNDAINRLPMTRLTPNTITSRRTLRAHLNEVRNQGYAVNEEEETVGVHGVAAPVFGHRGEVVASVCITIPSFRYDAAEFPSYAAAVVDAANAVSRRMGYTPP